MDRDALVEKMAIAVVGLAWVGSSAAYREIMRSEMRAALAVAEPVVRADERDSIIRMMKRRWKGGYPGEVIADLETAIRTGGTP